MKSSAVEEGVRILDRIASALLASGFTSAGDAGAEVRRACGTLQAGARTALANGTAGAPLLACFDAARTAGTSLDGMAQVRAAILLEAPVEWIARAVVAGALRLCLSQEARILASTTLVSRNEVDRFAGRMNEAFASAEEAAADNGDAAGYRSLVSLHAAVTRDLDVRARPLPRMVDYRLGGSVPAIVLANRLYGDASRGDDLVRENGVVHPLFMPALGRALSA